MLTIFSTAKSFDGHYGIIQMNALESWSQLPSFCEVIIFGDEPGTAEATHTFNFVHIPNIDSTKSGLPLISDMFKQAQEIASTSLVCYLNSDIILSSDFRKAVSWLNNHQGEFLLLSQRLDIEILDRLDFSDQNWEKKILHLARENGEYGGPTCNDCFLFPRGMYEDIPPFAVGRVGWDNWIIYHTLNRGIPIIDATQALTLIHQNHTYPIEAIRTVEAKERGIPSGTDTQMNLELAGEGGKGFHGIWDANQILTTNGIETRPKNFYYYLQHGITFSIRNLNLRWLFRFLLKFNFIKRFWVKTRGR